MSLYVRKEDRRVSPDLVAYGLQTLARLPADHEEPQLLAGYELDALLNYLHDVEFDEERLGLLEWQFLPALGFNARSPVLERRLARAPEFFAEILSLIYKPRGSDEDSEVPKHVASNAHRLLDEWKIVPGSDDRMEAVNEHAHGETKTRHGRLCRSEMSSSGWQAPILRTASGHRPTRSWADNAWNARWRRPRATTCRPIPRTGCADP